MSYSASEKQGQFVTSSALTTLKSAGKNGDRVLVTKVSSYKHLIAVADGLSAVSKPWVGAQICIEKLSELLPQRMSGLKATVSMVQNNLAKITDSRNEQDAYTTIAGGIFDEQTKVFSSVTMGDSYNFWFSLSKAEEYLNGCLAALGLKAFDEISGLIGNLHCQEGYNFAARRGRRMPSWFDDGPGILFCLGVSQYDYKGIMNCLENSGCSPYVEYQIPCDDPVVVSCTDGVLTGLGAYADWETAIKQVMALAVACKQAGREREFANLLVSMSAGHVRVKRTASNLFGIEGHLIIKDEVRVGSFLARRSRLCALGSNADGCEYGRHSANNVKDDISAGAIFYKNVTPAVKVPL